MGDAGVRLTVAPRTPCPRLSRPSRLTRRRPHAPPRHRPGSRAEPLRSRVTVMAGRHVWAVQDRVYLLRESDVLSMRVRGMISRIGPDKLVHHPGNLDDSGEKEWTMCAQRVDDSWPLLYSSIVDCAECGAGLQRKGLAVAMSLALARSFEDRFMGGQPV